MYDAVHRGCASVSNFPCCHESARCSFVEIRTRIGPPCEGGPIAAFPSTFAAGGRVAHYPMGATVSALLVQAVIDESPLDDPAEWALHVALAYLADEAGVVVQGAHIIGATARMSHERARRLLPKLEARGLVETTRRVRLPALRVIRATSDVQMARVGRQTRATRRASGARLASAISALELEEITTTTEQQPHVVSLPLNDRDLVTTVFDAWCDATDHRAARLTGKLGAKRRRMIATALQDYPIDDVLDAVRGWRHSAHHRGENDSGTVYNSIELLLRDAEHIERFRDLERRGPVIPPVRRSRTHDAIDAAAARMNQHPGGNDGEARSNGAARGNGFAQTAHVGVQGSRR